MARLNDDLRSAVSRWIDGPEPQHALLIEGPWGCGKTHLVRDVLRQQSDDTGLYVSLYGVQSVADFDAALLRARWPAMTKSSGKLGQQFKDFVSGSRAFGLQLNVNAFSATEFAVGHLPRLLIFDDLERAEMPMRSLMGAINRFVEHQGKHVILLANEEAIFADDDRANTYRAEKEKLVGRTLRVVPDAASALRAIMLDVPEPCRGVLQDKRADVLDVFEQSQTHNLRLLRQTLIEFSTLHASLPTAVTGHLHGMTAVLRCFLALSFDVLCGRLPVEDLTRRDQSDAFGWGLTRDEADLPPLGLSQNRYRSITLHAEGSALSVPAAVAIIGKGQRPPWLADDLLRGPHFKTASEPEAAPLYAQLWHWRDMPYADAEKLFKEVHAGLVKGSITGAGDILHIYKCYVGLAKSGIVPGNIDPVPWFCDLIAQRGAAGQIPAREPGKGRSGGGYGFSHEMGMIRYGGYAFDVEEEDRPVIDTMMAAQDAALNANLPNYTEKVCTLLRDNPDEVLARFKGERPGDVWWNRTSILCFTDVDHVTDTLIDLWTQAPATCDGLARAIAHRRHTHNHDIDEDAWITAAHDALLTKAAARSPVLQAQVSLAIRRWAPDEESVHA